MADQYAQAFRRARLDAARRLGPEYEDRAWTAKKIGISDSYLKKIESGEKRPAFETLEAMAKAYHIFVGDLFPSSAIRGGEIGRLVAPLMTLDAPIRSRLIGQLETFAEFLAGTINQARDERPQPVANGLRDADDRPSAPIGV